MQQTHLRGVGREQRLGVVPMLGRRGMCKEERGVGRSMYRGRLESDLTVTGWMVVPSVDAEGHLGTAGVG